MTAAVIFAVFLAGVVSGVTVVLILTGHRWTAPQEEQ
jgi:hypothetical protein